MTSGDRTPELGSWDNGTNGTESVWIAAGPSWKPTGIFPTIEVTSEAAAEKLARNQSLALVAGESCEAYLVNLSSFRCEGRVLWEAPPVETIE